LPRSNKLSAFAFTSTVGSPGLGSWVFAGGADSDGAALAEADFAAEAEDFADALDFGQTQAGFEEEDAEAEAVPG